MPRFKGLQRPNKLRKSKGVKENMGIIFFTLLPPDPLKGELSSVTITFFIIPQ